MGNIKGFVLGLVLAFGAFGVLAAEPVDINTATAEEIAKALTGIGKAKAEAIVKDREKNGKFKSVDDLTRVKGIKAAIIAKNRDKMTVGAEAQGAGEAAKAPGTASPATVPVTPPAKVK